MKVVHYDDLGKQIRNGEYFTVEDHFGYRYGDGFIFAELSDARRGCDAFRDLGIDVRIHRHNFSNDTVLIPVGLQ